MNFNGALIDKFIPRCSSELWHTREIWGQLKMHPKLRKITTTKDFRDTPSCMPSDVPNQPLQACKKVAGWEVARTKAAPTRQWLYYSISVREDNAAAERGKNRVRDKVESGRIRFRVAGQGRRGNRCQAATSALSQVTPGNCSRFKMLEVTKRRRRAEIKSQPAAMWRRRIRKGFLTRVSIRRAIQKYSSACTIPIRPWTPL